MNYDEMTYEQLKEEQDRLIVELNDCKSALEFMQKVLNDLKDAERDVVMSIYESQSQLYEDLDSEIHSIEIDLDDIEYQMQILEDMYDDRQERWAEYREMQGF